MNTWGILSINNSTFNQRDEAFKVTTGTDGEPIYQVKRLTYPKPQRDTLITTLRILNLTLDVLGYSRFRLYSGIVRIGLGLSFMGFTYKFGSHNDHEGVIIGRFYGEAMRTEFAQTARGAIEAFVPKFAQLDAIPFDGRSINLGIGFIAGCFNLANVVEQMGREESTVPLPDHWTSNTPPHPEPTYPILLYPLYLV